MRELGLQEDVICRQVQVEASVSGDAEVTRRNREVEHVSADSAVVAQEVQVQSRHGDSLVDRRSPEAHQGAPNRFFDGLDLMARHLREAWQRMPLSGRDPHPNRRQPPVESYGVKEIPAREGALDSRREASEVLLADGERRDIRKSTHDGEREHFVVGHRDGRTVERALDRHSIDDDDLAAEMVDAPEPEVTDRASLGDSHARLVGTGEQGIEHCELGHGGAWGGWRSGHRASVPGLARRSRHYDHRMATFASNDGSPLAVHEAGGGRPLVCLPGGPMKASTYLGDLGGLSDHRALQLLDLRGTGDSPEPTDAASYRVDRQVDDVEALRRHLGLDRVDLLAHSAGAALALLYASRHPDRIGRLVLVCPTPKVVGIDVTDGDRREVAELRRDEPWFADAFAAFERIWSGHPTDADWDAIEPFTNGRWDAARQAHAVAEARLMNMAAAREYYARGAIDTHAVRSALAHMDAPVLLVAGEFDVALPPTRAAEYAELVPRGELVVVPRAGHSPWLDEPDRFIDEVAGFLNRDLDI